MLTNLISLWEMLFQGPRGEPETRIPCPSIPGSQGSRSEGKQVHGTAPVTDKFRASRSHLSSCQPLTCQKTILMRSSLSARLSPIRLLFLLIAWWLCSEWPERGREPLPDAVSLNGRKSKTNHQSPTVWGNRDASLRSARGQATPAAASVFVQLHAGAGAVGRSRYDMSAAEENHSQSPLCHLFFTTSDWLPVCLHSGRAHLTASTVSVQRENKRISSGGKINQNTKLQQQFFYFTSQMALFLSAG